MLTAWLLLIAGLAVLVGGAELLVRGASGLGRHLGISPLVIGLTVVAFGTSSPELAVSLSAVLGGRPDLAIGTAIGSNIFNVLVILGLSALVRPLVVERRLVRVDVPIMLGTSAALWPLLMDGRLGRTDGLLLFAGFVAYVVLAVRVSHRESRAIHAESPDMPLSKPSESLTQPVVLVVLGLAGTVVGSQWLVRSSVVIATAWGVSELTIGLTIVAGGTSLPEMATSLVAAVRGQRDIAVGNVVGSNIFNVLAILGVAGLVAPEGVPVSAAVLAFDLPVMVAAAVCCLPIVFTGHEIRRWEGGLLLAAYSAYVTYLVLDASGHDGLSGFSALMLWFALPIAAIGIGASVVSSLRANRAAPRLSGRS
jgi:cation:H+ antiporter